MKTRSSWFPALWVGGDGESVRSNVVKRLVKSDECNFSGTQDEWCAVFGKAAEEGIHLIEEVAEGAWRTVDHCNVELDGKGDCHSMSLHILGSFAFWFILKKIDNIFTYL